MTRSRGGTITWYQCCQAGLISAIAQTTTMRSTNTTCLPLQANIVRVSSRNAPASCNRSGFDLRRFCRDGRRVGSGRENARAGLCAWRKGLQGCFGSWSKGLMLKFLLLYCVAQSDYLYSMVG